jgi:hypothetical protein
MKKNMDLIREILLITEENCVPPDYIEVDVSDFLEKFPAITEEELREHIIQAEESGLIESKLTSSKCYIDRLTPAGHAWLAEDRTPTPPPVKSGIMKRAVDEWCVDFLKQGFWIITYLTKPWEAVNREGSTEIGLAGDRPCQKCRNRG